MEAKDIISIGNSRDDLARYEELLLRRDNLKKQAEQYQISYFRKFGDLIVDSFKIRIECIRKKKIIAYCQTQINQGRPVNGAALDHFIEREMEEYQSDLKDMIRHNKAVKEAGSVSEYDLYRIKKMYRDLAKLIHPDLHPELEGDPRISEFWQKIVLAYEHNQFEDMEELDFQVRKYLEDKGGSGGEVIVPDLDKKIRRTEQEIDRITGTEPYLYRLLLQDDEAVAAKEAELREEIDTYTEYSRQLDEVIDRFSIERNYS